jgi:hypothetical protein
MRHRGDLTIWTVADVLADQDLPAGARADLAAIAAWSREFLVPGHAELGRSGPVCPFTKPSLDRDLFYLSRPPAAAAPDDIARTVLAHRDWHADLATELPERDRQLLTILVLLPEFDHTDPTPLDELQARLKDDFVREGLMIGQFHPRNGQPGLWNEDFRPLRAPIPLLAIRHMVPFDLPFLVHEPAHLAAYLTRFAPDIPARIRSQLVDATRR